MTARHDVITSWIAQWETPFVELAVFGTSNSDQIAHLIDRFSQTELGSAIADYLFYESSIGAVCGVSLMDGRRVVIKVHQPSRSLDFLNTVVRTQRYLANRSYPCPMPLLDPRPLASGIATTEELIDAGEYHQAHDPFIRRLMAEMLARLHQLTWNPEAIPGISPSALDLRLPPGVIWPTPHSKLFDFEATAAGAAWIDEIARQMQEIKAEGEGQLVLGHSDWGVKHFRFINGKVHVIYDWDSLALEKEPVIVGHASGYFTYTEFFPGSKQPAEEEAGAFVCEYEAARGRPFTAEEHRTLNAARLYELAYSARCEHALHPNETTFPVGSYRASLVRYRSL